MTGERVEGFRLSPHQARLWRAQRDAAPLLAEARIDLSGPLDRAALRRSLEAVAERHQALRTGFPRTSGMALPIQVISDEPEQAWREVDGDPSSVDEVARELRAEPFDLSRGPFLRAALVVHGEGRATLLLALPSLRADTTSWVVLFQELVEHYASPQEAAAEAPEDELVQFLEVSEWIHELHEDPESEAGRRFWQERLLEAEAFAAPLPVGADASVATLGAEVSDPLSRLTEALGAGPADVLVAAWATLLWRGAPGPNAAVDLEVAGRRQEELEGALGPLDQELPLVVGAEPGLPFAMLVARVEARRREVEEWSEVFDGAEGAPSAELAVVAVRAEPAARRAAGVEFVLSEYGAELGPARLGLTARMGGEADRFEIVAPMSSPEAVPAERWGERLAAFLEGAAEEPHRPVERLPLLGSTERGELLAHLAPSPQELASDGDVLHAVRAWAQESPSRVAVSDRETTLTYGELDAASDRLAKRLAAAGAGVGERALILLDRRPELLVAILAVWKAGATFVPLEVGAPPLRTAAVVGEAGACMVISRRDLVPAEGEPGIPFVAVDADDPVEAELPSPVRGESAAYVMFTSGSTGRPKGVVITHRGLSRYLAWSVAHYRLVAGSRSLVHSPVGFDLTVTGLLAPLVAGGTVELVPAEGPEALTAAMMSEGERVDLLKLTPSHLELLRLGIAAGDAVRWPQTLILGGEALLAESLQPLRQASPDTRVFNEYGPTETVVGCCVHQVAADAESSGPVSIGRPGAAARLYVLDPWLEMVPTGIAGELFVGGPGVARGYLGRPAETARSFLPDPFASEPGQRLYRTGDRVRAGAGGNLDFLGRIDGQLKLRGHRVETGEIEAALVEHPDVGSAAVAVRKEAGADGRLVAYLTLSSGRRPDLEALRSFLGQRLPDAVVPSMFMTLTALPLTANGKVDRGALPEPDAGRPELLREYVAPEGEAETALCEIWAEALGISRVGAEDNFFALGGDSMRSVRVAARAKHRGLEFTVQTLFRFPTARLLAQHLASDAGAADPAGEEDELEKLVSELEGSSDEEVLARLGERSPEEGAEV